MIYMKNRLLFRACGLKALFVAGSLRYTAFLEHYIVN